jgi:carbon-monoxide dehydrogenase large subunit
MRRGNDRLLGARQKRLEDPRLLLGEGRYVGDVKLHGMVQAAFVRSPHAHALIRGIDVSRALADPRVLGVLTAADLDGVPRLPSYDSGPEVHGFLQPVLADGAVRYVGEPIAAVVAEDRYAAEDALDLIDVDYEVLEAVVDPEAALREDGPLLHSTNVLDVAEHLVGEPGAVDRAPHVVRGRYRVQRDAGMPIETRGTVAEWDPRGTLAVYTSTQVPHLVRDVLAGFMGLRQGSVRVITPDVGGGFGTKLQVYPEDFAVCELARRLRRPVKWIEDRWEHFVATTHGREQIIDIEVGYDDDGTVLAVRGRILTNTGAYAQAFMKSEPNLAAMLLRGPYRIASYECTSTTVATNKTPSSPYRGVGMVQPVLALERSMDMIAEERGIDPVQLRLKNMIGPEEMPYRLGVFNPLVGEFVYDSGDYAEAFKMALDLAGYDELRAEQERLREQGRHLGIGMAPFVEVTTIGPYESGTVRVEPSGRIVALSGAGPIGQGSETVMAQVVADQFGVPIEDVTVLMGDTDIVRRGVGSFSSRVAGVGGTALAMASEKAKAQLFDAAAGMLEVSPGDLELREGRVVVKGSPASSLTIGEVAAAVEPGKGLPEGIDSYGIEASEMFHPPESAFSYGTVIAVVEVDVDARTVKPLKLVMVGDAGTMINPLLVDGQYHGGLAMGLGEALLEQLVYGEDGQPLNPNFLDFRLPQMDNMPEVVLGHTETPTPHNPLGIKGAGESGAIPPPAAFACAVSDALRPFGVAVNDIPILPGRLHELLEAAEARSGSRQEKR